MTLATELLLQAHHTQCITPCPGNCETDFDMTLAPLACAQQFPGHSSPRAVSVSSGDITGTASMDELALALGSKDDKKDDTVKVSAPSHSPQEPL